MDIYDRIQPDDMKQAATIMAAFAWQAANLDGRFPRKPAGPGPARRPPRPARPTTSPAAPPTPPTATGGEPEGYAGVPGDVRGATGRRRGLVPPMECSRPAISRSPAASISPSVRCRFESRTYI